MLTVKHDCYILIQQIAVKQYPFCRIPDCGKLSVAGHHLFKRDKMGTAFNPEAVFAVCQVHHGFAHAERKKFREIAQLCLGDKYEQLRQLSEMVIKFRDDDFKRIRTVLRGILEQGEWRKREDKSRKCQSRQACLALY